jgi:hypothetical protein
MFEMHEILFSLTSLYDCKFVSLEGRNILVTFDKSDRLEYYGEKNHLPYRPKVAGLKHHISEVRKIFIKFLCRNLLKVVEVSPDQNEVELWLYITFCKW